MAPKDKIIYCVELLKQKKCIEHEMFTLFSTFEIPLTFLDHFTFNHHPFLSHNFMCITWALSSYVKKELQEDKKKLTDMCY